ncbi:sortase [Candidatus Dojkabacteria bacterium]|nr:sortase [Candidatus Dojkabacteria bacterium]
MLGENRGIVFTILLVIFISIAALIGVVYSLVQSFETLRFGEVNALSPDREVDIVDQKYDYNFAVPAVQQPAPEDLLEEQKPESEAEVEVPIYNYNFPIPEFSSLPAMKSIQIPSIKYNSPVVISNNADTGIDKGAWYYPSNHPAEGEAIFLCHRRYFGQVSPKSCWNLDKVKTNDYLYLNFNDGTQYTYKVVSISVADGSDISIYHASEAQELKLISCAKENGRIGSDSHRIVLIAKKVG